ncbi:MAG: CapA family protein [Candidatus Staskawiczbacteria bacterium]
MKQKFGKSKIILVLYLLAVVMLVIAAGVFLANKKQEVIKKPLIPAATKNYAQILFAGDMMFDRGIEYYAEKNKANSFVFDKISSALSKNDLVVANLEGPITGNKSLSANTAPGSTDNFLFTFDPSWAATLFKQNIKLVDLGNNHILNFGYDGVTSTKKYLSAAGVDYFGAPGGNKSIVKNINGIKIGFVSYNQFSAQPDEEKETTDEIKKIKSQDDFTVVFCHWGNEYQLEETDGQKNLGHQFIDAGADLVIGAHPHVIQPMEIYKGKRIYYSLGNFIFDQYFSKNVRNGLGVFVSINKTDPKSAPKINFSEEHFYLQNNGQTIEKVTEK